VHEVAAHRLRCELAGKLGESQQPVGVPGGPVRVVPVDDPVDEVVRLGGLVEEVGDPAHATSIRHPAEVPIVTL